MQKFLKALCFSVTLLLLAVPSVFADEIIQSQADPLSPAYLEWLRNDSDDVRSNGYVPIPIDLSYLSDNPPVETNDSPFPNTKAAEIPAKYDLRNVDGKSYVTSVKDQGSYGTCWAHASIGAIESNLLMKGLGTYDLSEMQLAWFTFKGNDSSKIFGNVSATVLKTVLDQGGNSFYPTAMFTRLSGPTTEAEAPYAVRPSKDSPDDYTKAVRLREVEYLRMGSSSTDELNVNSSAAERNNVKRRIMEYGSVMASYCDNQSNNKYYYNKTASNGTAFYYNSSSTNHAVQIVGWDDSYSRSNFRTNPGVDGAWLIKNSWGTSFGDNGYFWMSYAQYLTDGTAFIAENVNPDMKVYDYSPLGWCANWGWIGTSAMHTANVFRSERDNEKLTEVGFFTPNNNLPYQVKVYTGLSSMPSSTPINGNPVATMSGTMTYAGWHTLTLNTPVNLTKGQYFSVVVTYTNYTKAPVEMSGAMASRAVIDTGSFFSYNGTRWETGTSNNVNATIKAYTVTGAAVTGTAPDITTSSLPDGKVSSAYSAALQATGTEPITWTLSGNVPPGLSCNESTGTISGTPTQAGSFTFTATASNNYGSDQASFTLTIAANTPAGYAPNIVTTTLTIPKLNQSYSQYIYAEGTKPITFSLSGNVPPGLSISDTTSSLYPGAALISGTPTRAGSYTFTITAKNDYGTASGTITFTIEASSTDPEITTDSIVDGYVGQYFSQTMTATSTPSSLISWAVSSGSLPSGLSISRYGTITGTPTAAGTYTFTLTASNTSGSSSKSYTMTVRQLGNSPRITTRDLPYGLRSDSSYKAFLTASSNGAVTWAVASGTLPAGLTLSPSAGTITGTPSAIGTYIFTVRATNSYGSTLRSFTIYVYATAQSTQIDSALTLPDGETGTAYYEALNAYAISYVTWSVSSGNLPAGLTLDAQSGVISGTPTTAGTYTFTVKASNAYGADTRSFTVKITGTSSGVAPLITTSSLPDGEAGKSYSVTLKASGTASIAWSAENLPAGLSLNTITGAITGTPSAAGTYSTVITATNSYGSDSKTYTLTVSAAGVKPTITTASLPGGQAGKSYSTTITAEGTTPITWTASGLPAGLSLNTSSGTLSGTPTRAGSYRVTITARNSYGNNAKTFTLTIEAAGVIPTITASSLADGKEGSAYSQTLTATGTAPITWAVTSGTLPAGLSLNASTGMISGTPTSSGAYTFTVTAANEYGTASKSFTVNITASLTGDNVDVSGYVGYALRTQLSVTASGSVTWRASSALPSGLSLSRTGLISGTPRTAGNFSVKVTATASSSVTEFTVNFTINARPVRPNITTSSLPNATVSEEYSQAIAVTGTDPITLTATGLPEGLTFDADTLTISGTPSRAGTYTVRITAENTATRLENRPTTKNIRLVVRAQPPVIASPGNLADGIMGESYSGVQFTATQGTEPITWRVSGQPSGMRMSASGLLDGTPSRAGNFNMTVRASNAGGADTIRVPITILQKPEVSSARMSAGTTDASYMARFTARGTTPITWNIDGLPDNMSFEQNSTGTAATVRGIPTIPGTYTVSLSLQNEAGTKSYTVSFLVRGVAPRLTATLTRATVGQAYRGSRIYATGTKPMEISYSISASDQARFGITSLEDLGLTFTCNSADGTAEITGTPDISVRNLPITFTATNVVSTVSRRVNFTAAGTIPSFTEPSAATVNITCEVGSDIDMDFAVTGSRNITYSMNPVSGFTLTQTGDYTAELTGTAPARDATTTLNIKATNADGSATKRVIIKTQTPPTITTASLPSGIVNRNYSARVIATGTSTIRWAVSGTLPRGLRFSNGTFSGRPTEAGTFTVTVTATNPIGTDSKDFNITVAQ
ncbi:MAG: putative Ig domain-containing protein [Synergistaceae bacterium]|nr:putative Ig domain-containing protein [Synergistaceae bacterium]